MVGGKAPSENRNLPSMAVAVTAVDEVEGQTVAAVPEINVVVLLHFRRRRLS